MAGKIRIHTDEHIATAIVEALRRHGVDVMSFRDAGLAGASDEEHLARAHSEQRAILTKDPDFIRMHKSGKPHSGILFIPSGRSTGQIIKRAILIYQSFSADQIIGTVQYL